MDPKRDPAAAVDAPKSPATGAAAKLMGAAVVDAPKSPAAGAAAKLMGAAAVDAPKSPLTGAAEAGWTLGAGGKMLEDAAGVPRLLSGAGDCCIG